MVELCSKFLETKEMGVKTSAPDFVTTRLGNDRLAHPSQQRTDHQHTAAKSSTFLYELVALQITEVQLVGLKGIGICRFLHLNADVAK